MKLVLVIALAADVLHSATAQQETALCGGIVCPQGATCDAAGMSCVCMDGWYFDDDDNRCEAVDSWEETWSACPSWFVYAMSARCMDQQTCERDPDEQEYWNFCLDFLDPMSPCHTDPNAMRTLPDWCAGWGMQENAECTPWSGGSSPCAEGFQCVSTWNNEGDGSANPPTCQPDTMMFTQEETGHGQVCAYDSDCRAFHHCNMDASPPACERDAPSGVCTADDVEYLMNMDEDDRSIPRVTWGCMACMAEARHDDALMGACMSGHGGDNENPPSCDFGALMDLLAQTLHTAHEAVDLSALADNPVYQECAHVAQEIQHAETTATCP